MVALLIMLAAVASFIAAVVLLWKSRTHSRNVNLIKQAIPVTSSTIGNVRPGQIVTVSGIPETREPFVSFQSETPCVYYEYNVIRRYLFRKYRTHKDGDRTSSLSSATETVAHEKESVVFRFSDTSGHIYINPDGAHFEPVSVMDRVEPATDQRQRNLRGQRIDTSTERGITQEFFIREHAILLSQPLHVVGTINQQGQIATNGSSGMIVSHRPLSELLDEWASHSRTRIFGCFGTLLLSVLMLVLGTVLVSMSVI
jgi:hypothetical protein